MTGNTMTKDTTGRHYMVDGNLVIIDNDGIWVGRNVLQNDKQITVGVGSYTVNYKGKQWYAQAIDKTVKPHDESRKQPIGGPFNTYSDAKDAIFREFGVTLASIEDIKTVFSDKAALEELYVSVVEEETPAQEE